MQITITLPTSTSPKIQVVEEKTELPIGEQLRREQAVAGLSRAAAARLTGVTERGLFQIENGNVKNHET
ncbi:helix-turn-helix domain-containing protein [Actinomycetaceae bacterium TAE3-ERU4]|nr:helix-turn-helix domain-containing protein [Actinomycetaceae bacterium TAE3-ERU4]